MNETVTTIGIVLKAMPIGDYDKRIVILTKEYGKVTVFAKGARRQNSRYMAGSMPFSFGTFTLYPGKDTYTMTNIDISDYFEDISKDIYTMYYGFYILELADYFSVEQTEGTDMLRLVFSTLKALTNKKNMSMQLIRRIYELKMLEINGTYPDVFTCQRCNNKENLYALSKNGDGIVCEECLKKNNESEQTYPLNNSTIYTMQYVISTPIEKIYSFALNDSTQKEFSFVMNKLLNLYVHKEMKSLDYLKMIDN